MKLYLGNGQSVNDTVFQIYQSEGFDWLKFPWTDEVHSAFHYLD